MSLLERVTTLLRANLTALVERAENPSTIIRQVIVDMENQLLQVKTQVAISIADQHMLEKKAQENAEKSADWMRKAELAIDKGQDDLARAALERHKSAERMMESFRQQVADQAAQVAVLKSALVKLEQKLAEAKAKGAMLLAHQRRVRSNGGPSDRPKAGMTNDEAVSMTKAVMAADDLDERLAQLERDDEIERLLTELKTKRSVAG
jgi:phage shock protein A